MAGISPAMQPLMSKFARLQRELEEARSRRLRDLTWEQVRSLDCGSQRNPRFPEQVLRAAAPLADDFCRASAR